MSEGSTATRGRRSPGCTSSTSGEIHNASLVSNRDPFLHTSFSSIVVLEFDEAEGERRLVLDVDVAHVTEALHLAAHFAFRAIAWQIADVDRLGHAAATTASRRRRRGVVVVVVGGRDSAAAVAVVSHYLICERGDKVGGE